MATGDDHLTPLLPGVLKHEDIEGAVWHARLSQYLTSAFSLLHLYPIDGSNDI